MKLFNTYCMPCYGWVLWEFNSNEFAGICCKWRQSIRAFLNIIPTTNNNLIHLYEIHSHLIFRCIKGGLSLLTLYKSLKIQQYSYVII